MLDTLKSNLTEEEQPYFALVPPGFRNPVDVKRKYEILPAIVLPVYQKSLHDHINAHCDQSSMMVDVEAVRLSIQIARSLRALHRLGIVHSDLKPANILLNLTGSEITVALTDFGGAVHQGEKIKTGTPGYMLKQDYLMIIAENPPISTTKFDIYSFGAVLHELVTGVRLVDAESPRCGRACWQKVYFVRDLINRCIQEHATQRPTADELIEELTKLERAVPAYNRRYWIIFGLSWLISIIVLVAVIWFCCRRRRRRRRQLQAAKNASSPTSLKVTAV